MKNIFFIATCLFILFASCQNQKKTVSNGSSEIEQVMKEYRAAWKKGDSALILSKLSSDIILFQPGKTGKPVYGKKEVSKFWFPASDISYPILKYEVENQEIEADTKIAYYQGLSKLTWCTLENNVGRDTITSVSECTSILKKENDSWKIYRIMYNLKDINYTPDME